MSFIVHRGCCIGVSMRGKNGRKVGNENEYLFIAIKKILIMFFYVVVSKNSSWGGVQVIWFGYHQYKINVRLGGF